MKPLEERIRELPPDLAQEVEDFLDFLLEKRRPKADGTFILDWAGALADLRDQYTSVDLQHKALEWWANDVSR
jgi:hypothetical protein